MVMRGRNMIVYCSACTCVFNSNGKCSKESIKLDNSEYDYGHNVSSKEYYGG